MILYARFAEPTAPQKDFWTSRSKGLNGESIFDEIFKNRGDKKFNCKNGKVNPCVSALLLEVVTAITNDVGSDVWTGWNAQAC